MPGTVDRNSYQHVLGGRYASPIIKFIHSDNMRYLTWWRLWLELARGEKQLGIDIHDEQLEELIRVVPIIDYGLIAQQGIDFTNADLAAMTTSLSVIDYDAVAAIEAELLHDVDSHKTYLGTLAPLARSVLHHGATSCYITDNADLIIMRLALDIIILRVARCIDRMARFASNIEHMDLPMLGYTHFQVAQPVTMAKRICVWINDLIIDLHNLERVRRELRFRGVKGTVGTQASFLAMFHGDHKKVVLLDEYVTRAFKFSDSFCITTQTYARKQDWQVVSAVSGLASTLTKCATDLRLLQHDREFAEPFKDKQKGSSAMPHKRNPMKCERICGLSYALKKMPEIALDVHAGQWLERTLDDSSARRIFLPDTFLLADAILILTQSIFEGAVVYPAVAKRHLHDELPLMAVEEIMVAMVEKGYDRQEVYGKLRAHALAAVEAVKEQGSSNDFLDRIRLDPYFTPIDHMYDDLLKPERFIGRAPEQFREFMKTEVQAALRPYQGRLSGKVELKV